MAAETAVARAGRAVGVGGGIDRRRRVLVLLALAAAAVVVAYCVVDVKGSWEYALGIRTRKVAAMAVVGTAIGTATVLFQTVTNNRILTPSIMGFDALYVLIQTTVVYLFGSLALAGTDVRLQFAVEVAVMVVFANLLHRWLFGRARRDLYVMVLVGIVLGTMFTSLSSLVSRLIDPNEFITLQDRLFATFGAVDDDLLAISAVAVTVVVLHAWRAAAQLDVVALGVDHAVNLGVDHRRVVSAALVDIAVLVSVATALVGPVTFLGLLVANLARQILGTHRHRATMPAAALLGVLALVGGQLVLERLFAFNTTLSIIIGFVGGIYFIALVLKEARR